MDIVKRRGTLVVVSAPSGAGKTTLCHEVRSLVPDLYYSVSYTTRAPRPGEVNGVDFHFVTQPEFLALRERDEFAEWAQVHGNLLRHPGARARGRPRARAGRAARHRHPGRAPAPPAVPEAVSVFIMAPSVAELEARLRERKSDAPGEIERRVKRARDEIAAWRQYDYLIINRDVKEAVEQLATIIQAERCRTGRLTVRFPDVEVPN